MHFLAAFQIDSDEARRAEILCELEACFGTWSRTKALDHAYVVRVPGYGVYENIQLRLLETARAQPEKVFVCLTPLMTSGLYHGRMRKEAAEALNTLTDEA